MLQSIYRLLYRLGWRHATIHFPDQEQSGSFNLLNVPNRRHFSLSPNSLRFEELLLLPATSEFGLEDYSVGIVCYRLNGRQIYDRIKLGNGGGYGPLNCDEKSFESPPASLRQLAYSKIGIKSFLKM